MSKNILITGASKGIGLTTAIALQNAGYTVLGTSRSPEKAGPLPIELLSLDVTDAASVEACVSEATARLGHIDVLINNAGYDLYAAAEEAGFAETLAQLDSNFLGSVRMITAVLPQMRERGAGQIVNISSIGGSIGLPYNSAYAASKFAIEGYSESLRLELLPFGIHVSLISPEAVATDTLDTSIQQVDRTLPAYAGRSQAMADHMRTLGNQSVVTPESVARTVLKAVDAPHPLLRYPVGRQAQILPRLKALIPQRWYERLMVSQFGAVGG